MSNPSHTTRLTGTIVEWNDDRGFGFTETDNRRVFVHVKAFTLRERRPEVGDVITFSLGSDVQGRPCAENATQLFPNARLRGYELFLWLLLQVLPLLAMRQLSRTVDVRIVFGAWVVINGLTFALYAADKRRARRGDWRISENILHWFELLGGWSAAFLAQRRLRHKISKRSYQSVFFLIIVAHQFAAIDYLQDWRISTAVHRFIVEDKGRR